MSFKANFRLSSALFISLHNIQVKQEGLLDAVVYGYASLERELDSGIIENITLVKSENLLKGIDMHYKKYLERLLGA